VSVRRDDSGKVFLEGRCPVEDAEQLLQMLQSNPGASCDLTLCNHLHTAVVQVILAARPPLIGPCGDAWVEQWIVSIAR
jgi:hypothetical protein